jgi:hypothetical protein
MINFPSFIFYLFYIYIVQSSYNWIDRLLLDNNSLYSTFNKERQLYIQKNLIKCIILSILSSYAIYVIIQGILFNFWNNEILYFMGLIYSIPDVISLIKVPNLAISTKLHHMSVAILSILNIFNDYTKPTFWRGIVIYAAISILSHLVNCYLAFRFLYPNSKLSNNLCKISLYSYILFCILNWIYQYQIIFTHLSTTFSQLDFYIYISLIHLIIWDDYKLITFLSHAVDKYKLMIAYKTICENHNETNISNKHKLLWLLRINNFFKEAVQINNMNSEKYSNYINLSISQLPPTTL